MFKYVLSVSFAVSLGTAATTTTTATCDGVTTVGTTLAGCNDALSSAHAGLAAPPFVDSQMGFGAFFVSVDASLFGGFPPVGSASSSASFASDYVLTLFGGTGEGFFYPCFEARSPSHTGGVMGGASFDGVGFSFQETPFVTNCNGGPDNFQHSKPFTYGVPQIVPISMEATAFLHAPLFNVFDEQAAESFIGFAFFDPAGHELSNVTYTLVEVPEPSAWSLLGVGLIFFLAVRIHPTRFRGRFHGRDPASLR